MTRACVILAAILIAGSAAAHDAPSGWTYGEECCSSKDCAPIPAEALQMTPDGVAITLGPREHPMVYGNFHALVPYSRVFISGDSEPHACIVVGDMMPEVYVSCIYIPEGS